MACSGNGLISRAAQYPVEALVASRHVLPDRARGIVAWFLVRHTTSAWTAAWASDSRVATKRVPSQAPSAPSASAAATPAPVAIPPAATGTSTPRATGGTSTDNATTPVCPLVERGDGTAEVLAELVDEAERTTRELAGRVRS